MARWTVGANTNLPFGPDRPWEGDAAARRVFEAAGFGGDEPDVALARQAFLTYDAERPELRGSYKLGFADIVDGELMAMPAGMRQAASRIPQTDVPMDVQERARQALDRLVARMQKSHVQPVEVKIDAPAWMQANARRGLAWYADGLAGDGVTEQTVNEARAMARGNVSEEKAARMAAWFARHMVDLDAPAANPDHPDYPSPGVVAHALWGGGTRQQSERAMAWAERNRPAEKAVPVGREYKASILMPSTVSDRTVTGIFSVYGNIDSYSDIAWPGMMAKTLNERGDRILHLWQHNMEEPPIAVIELLREVNRSQLPAETLVRAPEALGGAEVTRRYLDTPRGNEVLTAIRDGSPLEMSFAFNPMVFDFTERSDAPLGVVRNLREIRLLETSDVLFGANSATVARKAMPIVTLLEALRVAVKSGARHSTKDTQLINQIAEAALELGATNVVLKTQATNDEEMAQRAAALAPEVRSDRRWQYRERAAMAALSLIKKG